MKNSKILSLAGLVGVIVYIIFIFIAASQYPWI